MLYKHSLSLKIFSTIIKRIFFSPFFFSSQSKKLYSEIKTYSVKNYDDAPRSQIVLRIFLLINATKSRNVAMFLQIFKIFLSLYLIYFIFF